MRSFISPDTLDPVPGEIAAKCRHIDRATGLEALFRQHHPDSLDRIAHQARNETVIASNEIEDIEVARGRAEAVVDKTKEPLNDDERSLAGYRAALDDIFASPSDGITLPRLLSWHRYMMQDVNPDIAGKFKISDNQVTERLPDGTMRLRFKPVPTAYTQNYMEELIARSSAALSAGRTHPIIVTAAFALDMLVIHPFQDGNGRTARIATTALLLQSGYEQVRYTSVERFIADRRNAYYASLAQSTVGWHEGTHSIWQWTHFLVDMLQEASTQLEHQLDRLASSDGMTLVRDWLIERAPEIFTTGDAMRALPTLSRSTIIRALNQATLDGLVLGSGRGRGAHWRLIRN